MLLSAQHSMEEVCAAHKASEKDLKNVFDKFWPSRVKYFYK